MRIPRMTRPQSKKPATNISANSTVHNKKYKSLADNHYAIYNQRTLCCRGHRDIYDHIYINYLINI